MDLRTFPVDDLWKRYLKRRDMAVRNELAVRYGHLVQSHAGRLSRRLPAQVSYDEICSAAFDGLLEAIEAYDPSKKAKFETFCQQRISGAVIDWLRSLDPQSRTVRTFERKRLQARELLDVETGHEPTDSEIARRMGLSLERYDYLCRLCQMGKEVHFSAMEPASENAGRGPSRAWDVGDEGEFDPANPVSREMLADYITRGLAREERLVLTLYYYESLTMAEIGAILNLSESRVSQIHKDILLRLRQRFGTKQCEELLV